MPVQNCTEGGKPGYRWGTQGKCYTFTSGNEASRKQAKQKAYLQGAAIGEQMTEQLKEANLVLTEEGYLTEAPQDKPGGSNVGQYKNVKSFCGPAGGAPAGSYPVNTRARAVAALAYAHNAPKPEGIRSCVCRHWPDLPACRKKESLVLRAISGGNWIDEK